MCCSAPSKAHKDLRRILVEDHKLDAVVKLPGGVFKPYAGVSTAILFFTKTGVAAPTTSGSMRSPPTAGAWTTSALRCYPRTNSARSPAKRDEGDHARNNLPDVLARWSRATAPSRSGPHRAEVLCPQGGHRRPGLRPILNRYKEVVHEEVEHRPPLEIMDELERIETEIQQGMSELKRMLA